MIRCDECKGTGKKTAMNVDDDLQKLCKALVETGGRLSCRKESFGIVMTFEFNVGAGGERYQSTLVPKEGLSHWLDMILRSHKGLNG